MNCSQERKFQSISLTILALCIFNAITSVVAFTIALTIESKSESICLDERIYILEMRDYQREKTYCARELIETRDSQFEIKRSLQNRDE